MNLTKEDLKVLQSRQKNLEARNGLLYDLYYLPHYSLRDLAKISGLTPEAVNYAIKSEKKKRKLDKTEKS